MAYLGCARCLTPPLLPLSKYRPLGALPVIASGASVIVTSINKIASVIGLNSSDPVKDQQRIDRINAVYSQAMAGDQSSVACLQDMAQGVSSGPSDPRACAVGSTVAAKYAAAVWQEYQARVAAGRIGGGLIMESPIPGTVGAAAMNLLPYALGAVIVVAILRRGRS